MTRVRKVWEKTPFNFSLYFVNIPRSRLYIFDEDDMYRGLLRINNNSDDTIFTKNEIKHFSNSANNGDIVIVYISNPVDESQQGLSPWILAHRIAHIIHDYIECDHFTDATYVFNNWFQRFRSYILNKKITNSNDEILFDDTIYHIGTMRSARTGNINGGSLFYTEFYNELFAQYLITGNITFNAIDNTFIESIKDKTKRNLNDKRLQNLNNELVNKLPAKMINLFNKSLSKYKGKILVI